MGKREWEIIEQLADQDRQARLVTISANAVDAEPNAEIVHEALIRGWKRLRDWLNEDRSFRLWLQKIEEDASEWKREQDRSYLLTGRKLDEARRWLAERSHEDITTNSYEFIATSIKRRNEIEIRSIESKISFMDGELNRVGIKYFVKDQYGFLIIITLMAIAFMGGMDYLFKPFAYMGIFIDYVIGTIYLRYISIIFGLLIGIALIWWVGSSTITIYFPYVLKSKRDLRMRMKNDRDKLKNERDSLKDELESLHLHPS